MGFFNFMEVWKDIKEYEGLYQVSNLGRVKSFNYGKEKILKTNLNKIRYSHITLCIKKNKTTHTIHRLVALAFISNPENKPNVNHINGIKTDNRVQNLEWCTQSENIQHAFKIGLNVGNKGEKNGLSKLTNNQVLNIKSDNRSRRQIAKHYNVSHTIINDIKNGKTWAHI